MFSYYKLSALICGNPLVVIISAIMKPGMVKPLTMLIEHLFSSHHLPVVQKWSPYHMFGTDKVSI
jgi:hypothetical protein